MATDVVTQLQLQLAELATVLFDSLGCLQRDAPTVARSVPDAQEALHAAAVVQAQRVAHAAQQFNLLIDQLPTRTEEEQCAALAALQARSEAAAEALAAYRVQAADTLGALQAALQQVAECPRLA
eukprot:GGOE01060790.1.p2 GENE.GGOE01060790.1~~GGOE01060790.1.p2  ORF type:complete len:132 (+),score=44.56 GGOE01060790.1:22-396(+)